MRSLSFAEILIREREKHRQTPEIIALHCNISIETYQALERDSSPSEQVLKKLCFLFDWNYHEYRKYLTSAPKYQTGFSVTDNPILSRTKPRHDPPPVVSSSGDIKQLCHKIQADADFLNVEAARIVSLQLSLVQQTIYHLMSERK